MVPMFKQWVGQNEANVLLSLTFVWWCVWSTSNLRQQSRCFIKGSELLYSLQVGSQYGKAAYGSISASCSCAVLAESGEGLYLSQGAVSRDGEQRREGLSQNKAGNTRLRQSRAPDMLGVESSRALSCQVGRIFLE